MRRGFLGGHAARALTFAVVAASAFAVGACGSSESDSASTGAGGGSTAATSSSGGDLQTINVIGIPTIGLAPVFVAQERGMLARHGLEMRFTPASSGNQYVAALASGQADVAGAFSPTAALTANAAGIDVKFFCPCGTTAAQPDRADLGLYTLRSNGIESAADLEGKTVAVVQLRNSIQEIVELGVREADADNSKIRYIQLPMPDSLTALENGQIDAAFLAEPFGAQFKDSNPDLVRVDLPLTETVRLIPASGWGTTAKTYDSKRQLIDDFHAAISEAAEEINADPSLARRAAEQFTSIEPDILARINLPDWAVVPTNEQFNELADVSMSLGYIRRADDASEWVIYQPASPQG